MHHKNNNKNTLETTLQTIHNNLQYNLHTYQECIQNLTQNQLSAIQHKLQSIWQLFSKIFGVEIISVRSVRKCCDYQRQLNLQQQDGSERALFAYRHTGEQQRLQQSEQQQQYGNKGCGSVCGSVCGLTCESACRVKNNKCCDGKYGISLEKLEEKVLKLRVECREYRRQVEENREIIGDLRRDLEWEKCNRIRDMKNESKNKCSNCSKCNGKQAQDEWGCIRDAGNRTNAFGWQRSNTKQKRLKTEGNYRKNSNLSCITVQQYNNKKYNNSHKKQQNNKQYNKSSIKCQKNPKKYNNLNNKSANNLHKHKRSISNIAIHNPKKPKIQPTQTTTTNLTQFSVQLNNPCQYTVSSKNSMPIQYRNLQQYISKEVERIVGNKIRPSQGYIG